MRNPDAVRIICETCDSQTSAKRRTGRLYSQQVPGEARVCLASGDRVIDTVGGLAPLAVQKVPRAPSSPRTPRFGDCRCTLGQCPRGLRRSAESGEAQLGSRLLQRPLMGSRYADVGVIAGSRIY